MKRLLLLISILSTSTYTVYGQAEGSVVSATGRGGVATTIVTDYHSIGINPANLGFRSKYETKHITFGLLEANASAFVRGVTPQQMNEFIFSSNPLSPANQATAASLFKGSNMTVNADVMIAGFSFQSDKLGGLAFSINDVARGYGGLSSNFTNMAFSGALSTEYFKNLQTQNGGVVPNDPARYDQYTNDPAYGGITAGIASTPITLGRVMNGTNIKSTYFRTFNAAYGREVFRNDILNITAGIGIKYVLGYYYMNMYSDGTTLRGNVAQNTLFSGVSSTLNVPNQGNGGSVVSPSGQGFGVDLGVTGTLYEKLKFGISIVNIGGIKYTKDVYDVKDTSFITLAYNKETLDAFNQTVYWKNGSSFNAKLPTMFRIGGSYALFDNKVEIGVDIVVPMNHDAGNINKTLYAAGGDVYLKRWFKLSSGFSIGGNYANSIYTYKTHVSIPFGMTFIAGENGAWEASLATRDIVSLIDINGTSPLYSLGICAFRFRV
ncbi:MAG: hypothetical protein H7259_03625 [Cytophagales bacterium]|nr:hypothetical protein [Cytophaga sp.]